MKRQGAVSAYAFVQFTDIRSVVKVLKEMEGEVWGSMKLKVGIIDSRRGWDNVYIPTYPDCNNHLN